MAKSTQTSLAWGLDQGLVIHLGKQVRVLGLGDSPNDLPLLEAADVAVVVPGPEGPHPALLEGVQSGRFQLAAFPHAQGWADAVQRNILDV